MEPIVEQKPQPSGHDHDVKISIHSTRGTKKFTFSQQTKVQAVIDTAVKEFGFTAGDKFQLALATKPGEPLRPEQTLASYHIVDGTELVLTAVGTGV